MAIDTSKCMFGCSEDTFVGYPVNKDDILSFPEKVELIAIYKQPVTTRGVYTPISQTCTHPRYITLATSPSFYPTCLLRSFIKDPINASAAELMYGTTIRLPCDFSKKSEKKTSVAVNKSGRREQWVNKRKRTSGSNESSVDLRQLSHKRKHRRSEDSREVFLLRRREIKTGKGGHLTMTATRESCRRPPRRNNKFKKKQGGEQ
ncbi:hypothetical protein TNIN_256791 [Trichonephila inaurata madagascariensis]|uniref:Uncharacterized protein n=1 Tax=Trichonephila inaurata madagascariensis TaxID=2747483 RepID=A0A8X6XR41_9ARAC|nr:hypothetical protein TNIN_256791 [Trichonephila inaurata madagascariensis]